VDGRIDDLQVQLALLAPCETQFVETPLSDAADFLTEYLQTPIRVDARRLEESGINIDSPVSLRMEEGPPFIECLARILASASAPPRNLVGDYRYGMLTITTPIGSAAPDASGVSQLIIPPDSPLASIWNRKIAVEFVETPLVDALAHLEEQVGLKGLFILDEIPADSQMVPVTMRAENHPFGQVLGLLLADLGRARLKDDRWIVISIGQDDQTAILP
jgi:hypothetical protein